MPHRWNSKCSDCILVPHRWDSKCSDCILYRGVRPLLKKVGIHLVVMLQFWNFDNCWVPLSGPLCLGVVVRVPHIGQTNLCENYLYWIEIRETRLMCANKLCLLNRIINVRYKYVKSFNRFQIIWIKNSYLKLDFFTRDYHYSWLLETM